MVAGASFVPPVQVEFIDAGGNRATSADPIVLAISNPGVMTGTTSVIAANGLATFGHRVRGECLAAAAERVGRRCGGREPVGRWGDATFTLRTNGTLAQVLSTPFRVTD
jgi:hypothetical protein